MSNVALWNRPAWDLDRWVSDFFGPATADGWTKAINPAVEVTADGDDSVIRVDLPGVDVAKDVTVEVHQSHLVIRGERRDERSKDADGRRISEVRYGAFHRSFALPAHVTEADVAATYEAGVLTVRVVGARKGPQPHRIAIESA